MDNKIIILIVEDVSQEALPVIDLSKHRKSEEFMDEMINKTRTPVLREVKKSTSKLMCAGVMSKKEHLRVIRFYKPRQSVST